MTRFTPRDVAQAALYAGHPDVQEMLNKYAEILANADTSALARHDAEVAARALEEAAECWRADDPWVEPGVWLDRCAAEKREEAINNANT